MHADDGLLVTTAQPLLAPPSCTKQSLLCMCNPPSLQEPPKKELLAWHKAGCPADAAPARQAFCILQTPQTGEG